MKNIATLMLGVLLLAACKNTSRDKEQQEESSSTEKKISKRDYSINVGNAYTDIFLDSMEMEQFITSTAVDETVARRLRSFYNTRNYQFAWMNSKGMTEQGRNFWNLHQYYTTYHKDTALTDGALQKRMNNLMARDSFKIKANDKSFVNTELKLTTHFILYLLHNYNDGAIKRKESERFVPFKRMDAVALADSLLAKKHKDNKYYSDVNPAYKALKGKLQQYIDIVRKGGWQPVAYKGKNLKPGMINPAIQTVRQRLLLTGELTSADTSTRFDQPLLAAVKRFQVNHGMAATGEINKSLIREMNVPADYRLKQLLLNLERMRWILSTDQGNLILVNIPAFELHVFEAGKRVFDMPVVVGKEGHNTTIFTGNLNQVVFSPYWNVTPNIAAKEIVPAMKNDPDYLARNNMEQTGVDEDGIPIIRQLPGEKNSLGKVKFLFPNSYDIYFHDTPAKDLFKNDRRAFSHGCIRLSDPEKMAQYLLRNQPEWTPDKINEAMNSGQEQFVKLKKAVPVLITYYTAWVNDAGDLNFREDVYNHDAAVIKKMFL